MCKEAINEIGNYAYLQTEITFPLWFQAQYISGKLAIITKTMKLGHGTEQDSKLLPSEVYVIVVTLIYNSSVFHPFFFKSDIF
jgi:hypothetical protein